MKPKQETGELSPALRPLSPSTAPVCINLCYSGLEQTSVLQVIKFQKKFPQMRLSNTFHPNVTTHLIVAHDNNMRTVNTLKYLLAVACGCWIISENWVIASLHANRILEVENYEMLDSTGGPAPRNSRLAQRRLFSDFEMFLGDSSEKFDWVTKENLEDILRCSGALLLSNLTQLARPPSRKYRLVFIPTENVPEDLKDTTYPLLGVDWVVESVEEFKLQPVANHLTRSVDDLLITQQGFPPEMLEPQEDPTV